MTTLDTPLTLRSGTRLENRICKASMNEAMATPDGRITGGHVRLYQTWVRGGASLLITGNMMVDGRHMNEPLVVDALHDDNRLLLEEWAATAAAANVHIWPQLNHPGKQSPKMVNDSPVAPSAVPIPNDMFVKPRALKADEIQEIIEGFARSAERCEAAGFTGIQLHGAHGYLIGQFLSPHHNRRNDEWGGSLENRLRFVTEIYRACRARTGKEFSIAIKLNSSDFQKGGFSEDESIEVAQAVDELGVDLIEVSGGSWENPINRTGKVKSSTRRREAYFLEYADKVRDKISAPLMVTGGFRSFTGMADAVESGAVDLVGVARPFAADPYFARHILEDPEHESHVAPIKSGFRKLDEMAIMEISWYTLQIERISQGKAPKRKPRGALSSLEVMYRFWKNGKAVKRARAA